MDSDITKKVVQSLAQVTRHADRELLNIGLAKALNELLDINAVYLYSVFNSEEQVDCFLNFQIINSNEKLLDPSLTVNKIDHSIIPCFDDCLKHKDIISLDHKDGLSTILYPVTNKLDKVDTLFRIELVTEQVIKSKQFIAEYFKIYKNYLNLLIDSELDTLTGLLNRRTFDRDLKKVLAEKNNLISEDTEEPCRRNSQPENIHWLAIADIDFFKRINDNYGHVYGDEVLLLLANIMRKSFRGLDILFRFGGEEFVIILRSTSQQGAFNALERFRLAVEEFDFPQVGSITTSIGFVEITQHSIPTEILGSADEALYFSKDNGRNQLNQYEKLVAQGNIARHDASADDIELF